VRSERPIHGQRIPQGRLRHPVSGFRWFHGVHAQAAPNLVFSSPAKGLTSRKNAEPWIAPMRSPFAIYGLYFVPAKSKCLNGETASVTIVK
jgi:hypothetical protein